MKVLLISFAVGLGVGVLYGLIRVKSPGVHPKTETEIMVTVLDQENACHERTRISRSMDRG
jgi:xanthosine utilization system XapX-like protein